MRRKAWRALALCGLLAGLAGCSTVSPALRAEAERVVLEGQDDSLDCTAADHCAQPSPLRAAIDADAADSHRALILDEGQDALLARIHLIRSARQRIDVQTFIFDEDDSGRVILRELVGAARRGVRVRLLIDQISAMRHTRTLAALAGVHANMQTRLYSPVLGRALMRKADYVTGTVCCFGRLNRRMHNKLLLVDGRIGLVGGRNYQDDYFDWGEHYNFRDRDVLLSGPSGEDMAANFEAFWNAPQSVALTELADVARYLRDNGLPPLPQHVYRHPERARLMHAAANDPALLEARLLAPSMLVEDATFVADLPEKHQRLPRAARRAAAPTTDTLYRLIESGQQEVLLQTPYLVFSRPAQAMLTRMRQREAPPQVQVSSNSLGATDAFMVYALSHKYKRRYLRTFGLEIYEFKPFPLDAPVDLAAMRALPEMGEPPPFAPVDTGLQARIMQERAGAAYPVRQRFPFSAQGGNDDPNVLKLAGVRIGLHAKSVVVDDGVGVVTTHNFDPRGDTLNTESAVIIRDARFAGQLEASIRRDMQPENAWKIAPHAKFPILPGLGYSLLKVSENLPVFDLMPRRYATSYAFMPSEQCPAPVPYGHADFWQCYRDVGAFPDVRLGSKWFATRFLTAFGGAWLAPIL